MKPKVYINDWNKIVDVYSIIWRDGKENVFPDLEEYNGDEPFVNCENCRLLKPTENMDSCGQFIYENDILEIRFTNDLNKVVHLLTVEYDYQKMRFSVSGDIGGGSHRDLFYWINNKFHIVNVIGNSLLKV